MVSMGLNHSSDLVFSSSSHGDIGDIQIIKSKAIRSIGSLLYRQMAGKFISMAGSIFLARILSPDAFGLFAVLFFLLQFFTIFCDAGIGAALIQKKGRLTPDELTTSFWLLQLLAWCVVGLVFFTAPYVVRFYPTLSSNSVIMIRVLACSLIPSTLKVIPGILLERNLDFTRIARIDIMETLVFQTIALGLAIRGFGAWSLVGAVIGKALTGVVLIYFITRWKPDGSISPVSIKSLIRFGIPFQGNSILTFIKDAVTPVFVGRVAGQVAVGYVNWAKTFAFMPLMASDVFGRIAFPLFARIQQDKRLLERSVERAIRMLMLIMCPLTVLLLALGPQLTQVIFTGKWMPGIGAFYFYCTAPLVIGVMMPLYSAILSLGQSAILLRLTAFYLVLEWGLGVPLVLNYGFTGIAMSQPVLALASYFCYTRTLRRQGLTIHIARNSMVPVLSSGIAFLFLKCAVGAGDMSAFRLLSVFCAGGLVNLGMIYLLKKELILECLHLFLQRKAIFSIFTVEQKEAMP